MHPANKPDKPYALRALQEQFHVTGADAKPIGLPHTRSVRRLTPVVMTDNDRAGDEAARQIKGQLAGLSVLVGFYRPLWTGKDPGELDPLRRRQMFLDAVRFDRIAFNA